MVDVFISYNREDQHRAQAITDALTAEGLSVWWDSNLRAGESYDEVTEKNLREAGAVVVLWSKRSVNSKWVRAEATIGERSSILVPAMIEECDRPLRFELVQAADLIRWHGDRGDPNWRTFVHDIKAAIGHQESAPSQPAAAAGSASPAGDVTIENTFWTSIKDGNDRSDFEAYLSRYPHGHFADLARNRLTALDRTATQASQAAAARAAAPARPVTPPKQSPAPRPAVAKPAAAQQQPRPPAAPAAAKQGPGALIYGLVALVVVAIGVGGFLMLQANKGGDDGAADSAIQTAAVSPPADAEPDAGSQVGMVDESLAPTEAQIEAPAEANEDEITIDGDVAALGSGEDIDSVSASDELTAEETIAEATDEPAEPESAAANSAGQTFVDCDVCPQMTILPDGVFTMGSPESEPGRFAYEGPQRDVEMKSFAIGTYEVTFDQWAACVEEGGCRNYEPGDGGFGRGSRPAMYISWSDAKAYAGWLTRKTGRTYRLPTEAEWEYAARGGTTTAYWWGDRFDRSLAPSGQTREAGSFSANAYGLYDMLGNVSEWVEDCYVNNFTAAPTDGTAVLNGDCGRRVVRGGSWRSDAGDMRIANRRRIGTNTRDRSLGFRVVSDAR